MAVINFKPFRLGLIQLQVGSNLKVNLDRTRLKVLEAVNVGKANVVVLPECFNSPYGTQHFKSYAEPIPNGETSNLLKSLAKEAKVYLIGGSIPEIDDLTGKLYNTCTVYDPQGVLIAKHRKVHLFDIDIPGKITFKESEVLSPGDTLTHVETAYGKLGLGICYDLRFPEMARIAADQGCVAMIYPGAFNLVTGPLHWELLLRARAVDHQLYVAGCSPARDMSATYHAWGHSTVVDPRGQVVATTHHEEAIVYADLDPELSTSTRESIPISVQARRDLF